MCKTERKNILKAVKNMKLKNGELAAYYSGSVMVRKWCYKTSVTIISTYHTDETISVRSKCKPVCLGLK
jgi:hypothetical protein